MAHSKALYVKNKATIEYSSTDLDRATIPFLADRLQTNPDRSIPTLQTGQPFPFPNLHDVALSFESVAASR